MPDGTRIDALISCAAKGKKRDNNNNNNSSKKKVQINRKDSTCHSEYWQPSHDEIWLCG